MSVESQVMPYEAVSMLGNGPALVLAPHPDDEVLGCAGAIMRHVAAGDPVKVIVLTDGAGWLGSSDDAAEHAAYVARRRRESRAAAAILGYGEPVFWDYRDRELRQDEELLQRLIDVCREHHTRWLYAPSVVEMHPDHRTLALVSVEVARRLGEGLMLAMYEVGVPLPPNRLLDISDLVERKHQAIQCFTSQLAEQAYDRHIEALNRFRTYTLAREVEAAEAYWVMSGADLRRDPWDVDCTQRRLPLPLDGPQGIVTPPAGQPASLWRAEATPPEQEWRARYEAIVASRSWRLTAPLRTLGRWWSALARRRREC
jgi:LmbE family N-acetylglucosaminyl deacetylase